MHGEITSLTPVDPHHDHVGTLLAGLVGVAAFRGVTGSATGDAIVGGTVGALPMAAFERRADHLMGGTLVGIQATTGESLRVITDQAGLNEGDCVAIEQTDDHVNLRRVSADLCRPPRNEDPLLAARRQEDALACRNAKIELLRASPEQREAATRRVHALCDT